MRRTTSKHMEPLWVWKWRCHLPIFPWRKLNRNNPTKRDQAIRMKTLQRWRLFPLGLRQKEVERFFKRANYFHHTIKLTAEISGNQITFLDTIVFKGTTYHPAVKNLKQILILRSSLTKKEDPLKTRWWEQKYNLKATTKGTWGVCAGLSLPLFSLQCPLSDFKKISRIWWVHLCLTSGRLVQIRIGNKSTLGRKIECYHLRWIFWR